MKQFTPSQNPIAALKKIKLLFSGKISEAEKSLDLEKKIEIAQIVIDQYYETMSHLSHMKKYKDNPQEPQVVQFKNELREQLERAKNIVEQSNKEIQQKNREAIFKNIDLVLNDLSNRINKINKNLPKAYETASNLLDTLTFARNEYNEQKEASDRVFDEAGDKFKMTCQKAINAAIPALEKDLGWGDYLKKTLETIANAIIYIVTATHVSGFFSHSKFNELNQTKNNVVEQGRKLQEIDTKENVNSFGSY